MNKYVLVLGNNPVLSLLELNGWFEAHEREFETEKNKGDILVVKGFKSSDVISLISELGGVIKVAEVIVEFSDKPSDWEQALLPLIEQYARAEKIIFGLSWHFSKKILQQKQAAKIGLNIKRELKKAGHKVRFVEAKELKLSSVQVAKNKLDSAGVELIISESDNKWRISKTVAVQPFEDWSWRDYGRPKRDAKSGMLPPKLARMMLNMLGTKPEGILLDPFCGSGTIATEADVLGWKKIICTDISPRAIADTRKNVAWYKENFGSEVDVKTNETSIEQLSSVVKSDTIRAVVTEGYLGPALSKPPRQRDIDKYREDLAPVYKILLREITRVLQNGGRAVIAIPRWIDREGNQHTLLRLRSALPPGLRVRHYNNMTESVGIYQREGQFVTRELVLLERKPRSK